MANPSASAYNADAIEVLSGLDPVRKRPGMYTDTSRPNHLAQEVIDNSVDEALAGHARSVQVTLHADHSLEVSDDGRTPEFLFVPYYGACIHVPPPPSNQIVHVTSQVGVKLDDLYQAFWVEGTMRVKRSDSELADAGYQMDADKIYIYELPE